MAETSADGDGVDMIVADVADALVLLSKALATLIRWNNDDVDVHRVSGLEADQDDQLVMVVGYVTDVAAYSCVILHLTAVARLLEIWYNSRVN